MMMMMMMMMMMTMRATKKDSPRPQRLHEPPRPRAGARGADEIVPADRAPALGRAANMEHLRHHHSFK
jgi:hypothetical protein